MTKTCLIPLSFMSFRVDLQAPCSLLPMVLSMISDNVFVATVYINEIKAALDSGMISRDQFDKLAVAVNTGTNIPPSPRLMASGVFVLAYVFTGTVD